MTGSTTDAQSEHLNPSSLGTKEQFVPDLYAQFSSVLL